VDDNANDQKPKPFYHSSNPKVFEHIQKLKLRRVLRQQERKYVVCFLCACVCVCVGVWVCVCVSTGTHKCVYVRALVSEVATCVKTTRA